MQRLVYSGFYHRPPAARCSPSTRSRPQLRRTLLRRYGSEGRVTSIDPRIGRLLMEPNVLTAVAVPRPDEGPA